MLDALSYQEKMGSTTLPSLLEQKRNELPAGRQRILLLVGSYDEAEKAHQFLAEKRRDWEDHIVHLVSDDDEFESEWRTHHRRLQRGMVDRFAHTGAWLLIAPLLAVERGHNILNEDKKAAIGAVYFLEFVPILALTISTTSSTPSIAGQLRSIRTYPGSLLNTTGNRLA